MRDTLDPAAHCIGSTDRSIARPKAADRQQSPAPDAPTSPTDNALFWPERFAACCSARPDHTAVVHTASGRRLSYGELAQCVARRRDALRATGVGPEVAVAILLPRSIERLVTVLAVVAAGGAYVPLDPAYPMRRRQLILEDTAAALLITDFRWPPGEGPPDGCRQMTVDQLDDRLNDLSTSLPALPEYLPQAAAYIIYTSGSTGRPRGVTISHGSLAWYTGICIAHYGLGPQDRIPQMGSISFDISVGEIFPGLAAGATIQLPPEGPMAANELLQFCEEWQTSVLFPATALWHELAREVGNRPQRLPSSLRLISFGGEKVSDTWLSTWLDTVGDAVQLFNGYGPTEATVEATLHDLSAAMKTDDNQATASVVIGHPMRGVTCHILDDEGRPVVGNAVGELCLGGPGLARGYLGHTATTALKFVPDPFGHVPGARLYRTGDLVRRGPGGRLEILGRADQQLKVRGYRIEPGEIEAQLLDHPQVAEAHVVTTGEESPDRRLVAVVVPHRPQNRSAPQVPDDASATATGILGVGSLPEAPPVDPDLGNLLRQHLLSQLPPHQVPSRIIVVSRLPLNNNRKVDRRRLVELAEAPFASPNRRTVGATAIEQQLAHIWQQILQVEALGLDDDFFTLGGDSILAIRAVAAAHAAGLRLTPREVFEYRTLRRLGNLLLHRRTNEESGDPSADAATARNPLVRPPTHAPAPLTPVQRWFFDEAELDNPHHFNQSMLVSLVDPDIPRLRRALDALVHHHETLRLRFRRRAQGDWVQEVHPQADDDRRLRVLQLPPTDTTEPGSVQEPSSETWQAWATAVQSSLDIHHGPMLRCAVFDAGSGRPSRLLIVLHHLIVDGVTWSILLQDLEHLYDHLGNSTTASNEVPGTSSGGTSNNAASSNNEVPGTSSGGTSNNAASSNNEVPGTSNSGTSNSAASSNEVPGTSSYPLPDVPTTYRGWALLQEHIAQGDDLMQELAFWTDQCRDVPRLVLDFTQADRHRDNTLASTSTVTVQLDRRQTADLLQRLPAAYRTGINDVLLCAVAMALESSAATSQGHCLIDVEGHGREELVPGVDLSRTAGWFTSTFPLRLTLPSSGSREVPGTSHGESNEVPGTSHGESNEVPGTSRAFLGDALMSIKEQLRRVPRRGIGFGLLFYLCRRPEVRRRLEGIARPEISFNYLGQLDALFRDSRLFAPSDASRGAEKCAGGRRPYVLEIDGGVVAGQLWINWHFSRNLHRRQTVEGLARGCLEALRRLIAHGLDLDHGGLTPSDVPLSGLRQADLNRVVERPREVEDLYPLAPMQEGMLFHHQLATDGTLYFEQSSWVIEGPLQTARWRDAWQRLLDQHPALRTSFTWRELRRPLQVVWRRAELPFRVEDLRHLDGPERLRHLEELLEADRRQGFDLRQPPLSRILLLRLGDERYRFVWSYHHALLDGWSIARLFDDAFTLYRDLDTAPLRVTPFRDYIAWLESLHTDGRQASGDFWRHYLRDLQRPSLLGSGDVSTHGTRRNLSLDLPEIWAQRLEQRAQQSGITLAVLTQGAWALLLAHQTGARDVIFGSTVSCRPAEIPGVENIVGLMINTLPVRCSVDPHAELGPWLQALQGNVLDIQQHQHYCLADIQNQSPLPPGTPLFDQLVVFENYPTTVAMETVQRRGDLRVSGFRGFDETNYTWTLGILPGPPFTLDVSYDPGPLAPLKAQRILARFAHLLRNLAQTSSGRLGDLQILTPSERHQILNEWGDGAPYSDSRETFLTLFEQQVARCPQAPAVVSPQEGIALTYGELHLRARRLAVRLAASRRLAEEPVGVLLERRTERIVATLAVLMAGGVYVPLDPTYPRHHLETACRTVAMERLVSHGELARRVFDLGATGMHCVEPTGEPTVDSPTTTSGPRHSAETRPDARQLAYVLFTSGSTGRPKPVAVPHGALHWYCRVAHRHYGIAAGDRVLHLAPVGFDFSICEIFPALSAGATLVLADQTTGASAHQLFAYCRRHELSVLFPPTALWHQLVDDLVAEPSMVPPSLRLLASGGERILPDKLRRWQRAIDPAVRLMSGYGPTETTVEASLVCLTDLDLEPAPEASIDSAAHTVVDASPLGRPLPGVQIRLLNDDLQTCGIGEAGEIFLSGPGLARGYWHQPAATAARFLPDPFARHPGRRMYRTGDIGAFGDDGALMFFGRKDRQLKVRGHRVEPGMVEAALVRCDGIADAAVVGHRDANSWLEAFVVRQRDGADVPWPTLRRRLRQQLSRHLPAPAIPAQLHEVEHLPTTPGGKIDYRQLVAAARTTAAAPQASSQPASGNGVLDVHQQTVADAWRDILDLQNLTPDSNFFALGGHSLLATRLVQQLQHDAGIELPLRDVFLFPTLGEMTQRIIELGWSVDHGTKP